MSLSRLDEAISRFDSLRKGIVLGDALRRVDSILADADWDETKHPRWPEGTPKGGQFMTKEEIAKYGKDPQEAAKKLEKEEKGGILKVPSSVGIKWEKFHPKTNVLSEPGLIVKLKDNTTTVHISELSGKWVIYDNWKIKAKGQGQEELNKALGVQEEEKKETPVSEPTQVPSVSPKVPPVAPKAAEPQFQAPFTVQPNVNSTIEALSAAAPKPTPSESSAINNYTDDGYASINKALRFGFVSGGHETAGRIKHLTSWLNKAELPEETVVLRRVSSSYAEFLKENAQIGSEFIDFGFASTSVSSSGWSGEVTMSVRLPKGAKAAAVQHLSSHKSEYEVLVQRGTKYKVVAYNPKTKTIYCEIDQSHLAKPEEM